MLNLPTDNLYKFMAICGLVIILFSVYYSFRKAYELKIAYVVFQGESEILKREIKFFNARVEKARSALDNEPIDIDTIKKDRDSIEKDSLEIEKRSLKLYVEGEKAETMRRMARLFDIARHIGIFAGLYLMIQGFILWKTRVQNPLDKQLAQAVRELEEKNSKDSSTT